MKKCRICKTPFDPKRPMQPVCDNDDCRYTYAKQQAEKSRLNREKKQREQDRKKRESLKTRSDYIKEAQIAANAHARYRDKDLPCISCGTPLVASGNDWGFDAGHYRSRGAAPHLRFDERNIHGQCKRCNRHLGGNYAAYRTGLIARYGNEYVEALEADNEPRHWSIDDLKAIRDEYRNKLKELKSVQ